MQLPLVNESLLVSIRIPQAGLPANGNGSRRSWLKLAFGSGLTALLSGRLAASNLQPNSESKIKSCIFVFYYGGPSHLDTYDLKPNATSTVRGEFNPISTTVPGIQICEHLPYMSQVMHHVALVRSMHHTNRLHDSASTETFTGRQGPQGDREEFASIPQFFPCHGGALSYVRREESLEVCHAVLPSLFHNVVDVPCQGGGFLGNAFDPLLIEGKPDTLEFRSPVLSQADDLPSVRIGRRRELLSSIEQDLRGYSFPNSRQLSDMYERAYELLDSTTLRQALDLSQETEATRQRYGMAAAPADAGDAASALSPWRPIRGQNLLQARRLVEAGVPFVTVNDFRQQGQNWDSHADNFNQNKKYLLPQADQSLSALIEDLDQRGLLESTLVVALGEFGRTPTINGSAGRDHWPDCYTILLAGGGVRGGSVYGASDDIGAYPAKDPATPADLAATIYWRFGIDPRTEIHDQSGRPWRLSDGMTLASLFS